jgi:hypothetical protein
VLIGDHLYGIDGDARRFTLTCVELATGKVKWKGDNISALMAADGKLICQGETGQLYLVGADPSGYKKLAQTSVFRAPSWAPPPCSPTAASTPVGIGARSCAWT